MKYLYCIMYIYKCIYVHRQIDQNKDGLKDRFIKRQVDDKIDIWKD